MPGAGSLEACSGMIHRINPRKINAKVRSCTMANLLNTPLARAWHALPTVVQPVAAGSDERTGK